ncbi:hypothetical protein [Burkholderia dolosa]|uniref:hypothetical protein n=1 Tax=Burkholderia dolosa TaxID=152500 RepID=UPI001581E272|nr:hypothetical protein [Burkholderia dolosa]UAK67179.1 hypothetical protein K8O94_27875 [Burkholderia dolosa]
MTYSTPFCVAGSGGDCANAPAPTLRNQAADNNHPVIRIAISFSRLHTNPYHAAAGSHGGTQHPTSRVRPDGDTSVAPNAGFALTQVKRARRDRQQPHDRAS